MTSSPVALSMSLIMILTKVMAPMKIPSMMMIVSWIARAAVIRIHVDVQSGMWSVVTWF